MTTVHLPTDEQPVSGEAASTSRLGDRVFGGISTGAGILILVTLAAVAIFLLSEAIPSFTHADEFTQSFTSYVGPLVFGTIWAAFLALLIAMPFAVGVALFISHYAPRRIARVLGDFIDLLAAIPSVVYGIWGISVLAPDPGAQRLSVARGQSRVHPALQGPGLLVGPHDHDRRDGARRHDPADHHGHLP